MKVIEFHLFISFLVFPIFSSNYSKHWLQSCGTNDCLSVINSCLDCLGELQCKECIKNKPECITCSQDIFDKEHLENIQGINYLLCDIYNPLQVKVCQIFCRGSYYSTGDCIRYENIPICKCNNNIDE